MAETATQPGAADQARDKAQEVGAQAKEKAQEAGSQARDRVRGEVDRRSTMAGEQAGSAAEALRQASGKLREDGNEPIAKGMDRVAERVESAGGWLRDSDGDAILRDVEDFGRRNPLAVVAGGIALGFAASRLLKASSRRRYESSGSSYGGNGHRNGTTAPRNPLPATTPDTSVGTPTPGVPPTATPATPREGLTDAGVTGGTPATSAPNTLRGGDEGARRY
jgi:hypothetical protein